MKTTTEQTFETLGDRSMTEHATVEEAKKAAEDLRRNIAAMVADWETPAHREPSTGYSAEIDAWEIAGMLAGVKFDDAGDRTPDSPTRYGPVAGEYIAKKAVVIS